jgi:glucose/arabinose dehydrogenase
MYNNLTMPILVILLLTMTLSANEPKLDELIKTDQVIWGFDFINPDQIIFTERSGKIKILNTKLKSVTDLGSPVPVFSKGQGGLLDVKTHPEFQKNQTVFITYAKKSAQQITTAMGSFVLKNNRIENFKELIVANVKGDDHIHFGSRIVFEDSKSMYVSVGDRNERELAQSDQYHNGKILKIILKDDLTVSSSEIFSKGHRNPQGLYWDAAAKKLWESEFGPRGGDELNLIEKNANYGWPVVTHGKEYWGPKIGEGTSKPGMKDSVHYWVPSISPSGIAAKGGTVLLACLSGQQIKVLQMLNDKVVNEKSLFVDKRWRFRDVDFGPDDFAYAATDDGRIVRWKSKE